MTSGRANPYPKSTSSPPTPSDELDPRRWIALSTLLLATFIGILDVFIVNVAAPSIGRGLGASFQQIQFIVAGYILAYAVALVTGGRIGDFYGRRRTFLIGLSCFAVTSLMCALAPGPDLLIAFRVLQGFSGALMLPQVLAIIQAIFPRHERARALGLYGATVGLGSVAGQIVGGVLIHLDLFGLGWRTVFLVNLPLALVALVGVRASLRELPRAERAPLDLLGAALLAAAVALLLWPLVAGSDDSWPIWSYFALACSIAAFVGFAVWELAVARRGGQPLLPPRLFRQHGFALGVPTALLFYSSSAGLVLVLSFFLQDGLGLTPLMSAVAFLPLGTAFAGASLLSRTAIRRFGQKTLVASAVLMAVGLVVTRLAIGHGSATGQILWLLPGLFLVGAGQGLIAPSLIGAVLAGMLPDDVGAASGGLMTVTQVANALGATGIGTIFAALLRSATMDSAFGTTLLILFVIAVATAVLLHWQRPVSGRGDEK